MMTRSDFDKGFISIFPETLNYEWEDEGDIMIPVAFSVMGYHDFCRQMWKNLHSILSEKEYEIFDMWSFKHRGCVIFNPCAYNHNFIMNCLTNEDWNSDWRDVENLANFYFERNKEFIRNYIENIVLYGDF